MLARSTTQLSLDREGFVLLHHQTAATDLYDEEMITSVYYPECERLMHEATGASVSSRSTTSCAMRPRPPKDSDDQDAGRARPQ